MHSMRQRGCNIVASAVSAFFVMAFLTAGTTILRDLLLRPHPVVRDVRVSGTSPLYEVRTQVLLSPKLPDAALYYLPRASSPEKVALPSNIQVVDLADHEGDKEEDRKRKLWQRQHLPAGYHVAVRTTHRIVLYMSGSIDFSPLWDWNTKSIYISFVARFQSPSTAQNDVVFLDAVMRPVSPPASMARLAALRRREREAKRLLDHSINAGTVAPSVAVEPLMTEAERQQLAAYEETLRSREHDHSSLYVDHVDRVLFLNESFKYFVDAFDDVSLPGSVVEVVLRYQVMSYSGWAPVREEVLGHKVRAHMPTAVIPFSPQGRPV
ncbi:hypothetical protein ABB37_08832 [Leptomonas pyrrhocoris]|uniref:Signal peptidase complex subunit 3 n=1 Tax=Leptomonas pyrrhocoris TaxID=157538 RepID=A0A0M9FSH0_LEPPY|nr:hypothetical protein ABB37_08832 [Leptomonas pyrrhocoris]KPA75170.1 hypothetical protein ABB37_08832 [Leptomonas pyrrhocoris]|eukprot:XP_015653609.1 hypothetical protein ABB37_08832 [Leptomonas pyrrhocoris]